jgi:hypothetical protein
MVDGGGAHLIRRRETVAELRTRTALADVDALMHENMRETSAGNGVRIRNSARSGVRTAAQILQKI